MYPPSVGGAGMSAQQYLLTGGNDRQLLPALRRALTHVTEIEIAAFFICSTGLELVFGDVEAGIDE